LQHSGRVGIFEERLAVRQWAGSLHGFFEWMIPPMDACRVQVIILAWTAATRFHVRVASDNPGCVSLIQLRGRKNGSAPSAIKGVDLET
jgi:hypothetical protein